MQERRRTHPDPPKRRVEGARTRVRAHAAGTICAKDGCENPVKSKGLCNGHYMRARRGADTDAPVGLTKAAICCFPECGRPTHGNGLCAGHYGQARNGRELTPLREWTPRVAGACAVEKCKRVEAHAGLCQRHYQRKIEGDPNWDRPIKGKRKNGEGHFGEDGYVHVYINGRQMMQHRAAMEAVLGRPLLRTETVHHVNGVRHDDCVDGIPVMDERGRLRSGNLELWSHAQPPGQEIGPKLRFYFEQIALYGTREQQALARTWLEALPDEGDDAAGDVPPRGVTAGRVLASRWVGLTMTRRVLG